MLTDTTLLQLCVSQGTLLNSFLSRSKLSFKIQAVSFSVVTDQSSVCRMQDAHSTPERLRAPYRAARFKQLAAASCVPSKFVYQVSLNFRRVLPANSGAQLSTGPLGKLRLYCYRRNACHGHITHPLCVAARHRHDHGHRHPGSE